MMLAAERAEYLCHARRRLFRRRLAWARAQISRFLEISERPYIAYSTGKDSTCVAHLVWELKPDVPAVYFDAQCAFPESVQILDDLVAAGRTLIRWPCEPFLDTLERVGGPLSPDCEAETMRSTVYRPVKALLNEYDFDGFVMGLRAEESTYRRMFARSYGALFAQKRDGLWECNPIIWWSWQDVWAYIVSENIPYNRAYDQMGEMPISARRISYWAGETGKTHGRWAWLRQNYPQLWNEYITRFPEISRYT